MNGEFLAMEISEMSAEAQNRIYSELKAEIGEKDATAFMIYVSHLSMRKDLKKYAAIKNAVLESLFS